MMGSSLKFNNEITGRYFDVLKRLSSAPILNMTLSMIRSLYNVLILIINLGLGSSVIQVMSVDQVVLIFL